MKKIILATTLGLFLVSCQQQEQNSQQNNSLSIVYIDSSKLLNEYEESKDIEAKYKAKSEQMDKELDAELSKFKADIAYFEKNAQAKGQQWAQQTGAALQEREQRLAYTQQAMMQKLQNESGAEMDSLVVQVRAFITEYGKEKNYDYILSTSERASTVLYAKEGQDITSEVAKLLNEKYKKKQSKEETLEVKETAPAK
jgi:outer membrane protein